MYPCMRIFVSILPMMRSKQLNFNVGSKLGRKLTPQPTKSSLCGQFPLSCYFLSLSSLTPSSQPAPFNQGGHSLSIFNLKNKRHSHQMTLSCICVLVKGLSRIYCSFKTITIQTTAISVYKYAIFNMYILYNVYKTMFIVICGKFMLQMLCLPHLIPVQTSEYNLTQDTFKIRKVKVKAD